MSKDTWAGETNRPMSYNAWLYTNANPVNLSDPSGHDPWWCEDAPDPAKCYRDDASNRGNGNGGGTPILPTPTPTCTPTAEPGKIAYLTFDDGPDPVNTPQIASYLRNHSAYATFFVIGEDVDKDGNILYNRIGSNQKILQELKNSGDAIGIHGLVHGSPEDALHSAYYWNHQYFDPKTIDKEVNLLNGIGIAPDHLMRAPGGAFRSTPFSGYEGWFYYGWDVDSQDGGSGGNGLSAGDITNNVVDGLKNSPLGPIILLHSTNPNTTQAIVSGVLLEALRKLGYSQFLALPRAGDNPGSPIW